MAKDLKQQSCCTEDSSGLICPQCGNKISDRTLVRCPRCFKPLLPVCGCSGGCGTFSSKGCSCSLETKE